MISQINCVDRLIKGNLVDKKKTLVIVTGMSGTGKTTVSNDIYNTLLNSVLLSFDSIKTNCYDIVGFGNVIEKKALKSINLNYYKALLKTVMERNQEIVIVEYPFNNSWSDFFKWISSMYNYQVITINMYAENFDILWERLKKRELSLKRHPAHSAKAYCAKRNYAPRFEFNYESLKFDYDSNKYTDINLGTIINIQDIDAWEVKELKKIILKVDKKDGK